MKEMTWNEFQAACKIAWATEGRLARDVHNVLIACGKSPGDSKADVIKSAWELYKNECRPHQYFS